MAMSARYPKLVFCVTALVWLACFPALHAQQISGGSTALTPVPRLVWFSGSFQPADRLPIAPVETVTLAVYRDEQGGDALWQEAQNVVVDTDGRYNVMMGSTTTEGLPLDLFTAGEPRWLGVRFNRGAEVEQPRVQLASVPYALKAIDADSLGGRPAWAYAPSKARERGGGRTGPAHRETQTRPSRPRRPGRPAASAVFVDTANLGNSEMTQFGIEAGSRIGLGTTSPQDYLHVSFDDQFGAFTGLAVQNRNGSANASSGMLFFDQNGALAQFQGFSNTSHEYRINNIASGGSINFLVGSSSRFLIAPTGNIGIGAVPAPTEKLRVAGNVMVDGNLVANGNIAAKYQDVAEWVETASPLEAGTVVIVDPTEPNRVLAAPKAYDTRVAGAVSRQPGLLARGAQRQQNDGGAERARPREGGCHVRRDQDRRSARVEPYAWATRCGRGRCGSAGSRCIVRARCSGRRSRPCRMAKEKSSSC